MQQRHLERFQDHADYDGSDVHRSPMQSWRSESSFFVRECERWTKMASEQKIWEAKKFRMILVPSCMMMFLFNSRWFSIPTWQNPWGGWGFRRPKKCSLATPPHSLLGPFSCPPGWTRPFGYGAEQALLPAATSRMPSTRKTVCIYIEGVLTVIHLVIHLFI